MNYFVKEINESETNLGSDGFCRIRMEVFRREDNRDELLGSYIRNYGTNFDTFFPFRVNGKDLALYSPDYTATRIMELPSCKDIGGEEPADMGFCPVDYFVPTFIDQEIVTISTNDAYPEVQTLTERVNNPKAKILTEFTRRWHDELNGGDGTLTLKKCWSREA